MTAARLSPDWMMASSVWRKVFLHRRRAVSSNTAGATALAAGEATPWANLPLVRTSEWVLILYFTYTALLAVAFSLPGARRGVALLVPMLLYVLAYCESTSGRRWTGILRDWLPPGLLLVAYWQMEWFRSASRMRSMEESWLAWDQWILHDCGLQRLIESCGALLPGTLEICYGLLYAIPPACVAWLYFCRRRESVDRFLFVFLLGTLSAYALLPHLPTTSPRLEFPAQDLPGIVTVFRRLNLWVLDHADIHTSVFPSGHVATAFSCALGVRFALPEKPWAGRILLLGATLVTIATVYGRYHYAADGLASILVCIAALKVSQAVHRD